MFNAKNKSDMQIEKTNGGGGTTLIGAGTTVKGDISSNSDLRIDGTIIGNIQSTAKVVIGGNGVVEGDISGNQADIIGKVSGNIRAKDLLQLRGDCTVNGNIYAGKLQVEPSAVFNGQCHMGEVSVRTESISHSKNGQTEKEAVLS
ncbi:MAG: polymer-forming cytoskeletal protein [Chitinophagaceae bacterium]|jgi:cytoskeletal protein CcmA (bactofilin family)